MREWLQSAEEAARRGGHVLRSWSRRITVREKSQANLVTDADMASQTTIHDFLRQRYPHHGFLGEEGLDQSGIHSELRWIIDPLDGTTNYVHGFPYYAVSIALQQGNELVVAAIYNPATDEMFLAARGCGATLNRQPLRCSPISRLEQALVMASLPVVTSRADLAVQRFLTVLEHAQSVQRTGSAALNLAYVAAGRIDGFFSSSLKPWDMAAGVLLVQEAGGRVTKMDGQPFQLEQSDLLATNGTELHESLSAHLCQCRKEGPPHIDSTRKYEKMVG
ncbi:MAG: inositol monophosphatase [Planctomycetaceae bacterium]|nr:MAG: inositol monophosphatase [Planctomycetaceae bacterium]